MNIVIILIQFMLSSGCLCLRMIPEEKLTAKPSQVVRRRMEKRRGVGKDDEGMVRFNVGLVFELDLVDASWLRALSRILVELEVGKMSQD